MIEIAPASRIARVVSLHRQESAQTRMSVLPKPKFRISANIGSG